jgi:hypothetical protein
LQRVHATTRNMLLVLVAAVASLAARFLRVLA